MRRAGRYFRAQIRGGGSLAGATAVAVLALALCPPFVGPGFASESSVAAVPARGLELTGTWYLLVHYRDEATPPADAVQWEDRLWRFEFDGSRLLWTEFPVVVFRDSSGRFEMLAGDRPARTLGAWLPNAAQLEEIARGLEIEGRGARSKSLRGSAGSGYRSVGGLRSESTSVIGYHESWRIDGLLALPVFVRDDAMGSGRTDDVRGHTRYTTTVVQPGGDELSGEYERDGVRHGRFRMWRMGSPAADRSRVAPEEAGRP